MSKVYSKSELAKIAADYFTKNNANVLYVTADGNCFVSKNRAEIHAGEKGQVFSFDRETPKGSPLPPEGEITDKQYPLNVNDTVAKVKETESIEELEAMKEGEERSTVLKAIDKRIETLTPKT